MKHLFILLLAGLLAGTAEAQSFKFDFTNRKKVKEGYIRITPADTFSTDRGYGYDLQPIPQKNSHAPFFFSVNVPDGNYLVTAVIGGKRSAGSTTLRGESRRLF